MDAQPDVANVQPSSAAPAGVADTLGGGGAPAPAPAAAPTPPQPNVSNVPQSIQADPNMAAAQPVQAVPPHRNFASKILGAIADVLGGKGQVEYSTDANGNQVKKLAPYTRGQQVANILGGAVRGFAAGAQVHGPNAGMRSLAAGAGEEMAHGAQQDLLARQQGELNYQNQQKAILTKAQVADANSRTTLNHIASEKAGLEFNAEQTAMAQDQAQAFMETNGGEVLGQHLTGANLSDLMSKGQVNATKHGVFKDGDVDVLGPDGKPVIDPQTGETKKEATYTAVSIPSQVTVSPGMSSQLAQNGVTIPAGATVNGSGLYGQLKQNDSLNIAWNNIAQVRGKNTQDVAELQKNPQTRQALLQFTNPLAHAGNDPLVAIGAITEQKTLPPAYPGGPERIAPNPMARLAPTIIQAYGGMPAILAYHNQLIADAAQAKKAGEGQADLQTAAQKIPIEAAGAAAKEAAVAPIKVQENVAEKRAGQGLELGKINYAQSLKDSRETGYAYNDKTGEEVYTNRLAASNGGLQGFTPAKGAEIKADKGAIRMLNDVQLNTSRYVSAARMGELGAGDLAKMNQVLNKAGWFDIEAKISAGGDIKVPLLSSLSESLSRQTNSAAYASMSPAGKARYDGFLRTMAAVPAYQKALTGIGRSNKEMLDLELNNIPNPTMASADILHRMGAFQENIDQASKGLPKFPELPSAKEIRAKHETQPANPRQSMKVKDSQGQTFEIPGTLGGQQ